jgi:hypothetical protein
MVWGDTANNLNWRRDSTDTSWNLWYPVGASLLQTSGWVPFASNGSLLTVSYASSTTTTVAADLTGMIQKGYGFFYKQSGTYTNDPSAGSSVVLDMTDTIGAVVGNTVTISSSAGSETTTITAVVANTSITVATLALNHTTTNPVVTIWKYAYIVDVSYSTPNTTLTLVMGSDFNLVNTTISSPYWTPNPGMAFGFPNVFNWSPTYTGFSASPTGIHQFRIIGGWCEGLEMEDTFGTSNANTFYLTTPVPALDNGSTVICEFAAIRAYDNGNLSSTVDGAWITTNINLSTFVCGKTMMSTGWTASGQKRINFDFRYPI